MTELTRLNLENPANFVDFGELSQNLTELGMEDDLEKDSINHLDYIGTMVNSGQRYD